MGVVYSEKAVGTGAVPAADGHDHLQAAHLFFDSLTAPGTPTHNNVDIMLLGSVVTGQATRRSDLDYFLVRRPLEGEQPMRQQLHILSAMNAVRERHHVHLEGQHYTAQEISHGGQGIGEPLWLAHVLHIQDQYPEWVRGRPVEPLRPYAIDIDEDLHIPYQRSRLAQTVAQYFGHKIRIFGEAGDFDPGHAPDLHLFQRALEAGKAYARKGIAAMALEGITVEDVDVTSKQNMREHTAVLLDRVDTSGAMRTATEVANELDQEYDHVLNDAVITGNTAEYRRWLQDNYIRACAAALYLAEGYFRYVDDMSWHDDTIVFDHSGAWEDDFSMQDSGGAFIEGTVRPTPIKPLLVNLETEDLRALIGSPAPAARETVPHAPTAEPSYA